LVPTTESLVNGRDRDSLTPYVDGVSSEDFLGSHVLRISTLTAASGSKETSSIRDTRGKVKQISTVNGRTVVLKESFIYSNKGTGNMTFFVGLETF
jgi:small subunit ribosomal protein S11